MVISHLSFLFSLLQLSSPIPLLPPPALISYSSSPFSSSYLLFFLSLSSLPLPMEFLSVGDILSLLLGVFWIDWKSLLTFFDVIYINWRPEMFKHKSTLHELVTPNLVAPIPTLRFSILSLSIFHSLLFSISCSPFSSKQYMETQQC